MSTWEYAENADVQLFGMEVFDCGVQNMFLCQLPVEPGAAALGRWAAKAVAVFWTGERGWECPYWFILRQEIKWQYAAERDFIYFYETNGAFMFLNIII